MSYIGVTKCYSTESHYKYCEKKLNDDNNDFK